MAVDEIRKELMELQDLKFRDFHRKLIPTVDPDQVIGVRTPELRRMAKQWAKREEVRDFLNDLPHSFFDENQLHAFLISEIKDYALCMEETERFLPYIDNWATCDQLSPKVFKQHKEELLVKIKGWIGAEQSRAVANHDSQGAETDCEGTDSASERSERTFTIRFGVRMLMDHFLDEAFDLSGPEMVAKIRSDEYYVNMMIAWYFATALAKQYDAILPFLEEKRLDPWTHNKAIQKAVESYRITDNQKKYLKTLKIKTRKNGGL